MDLVKSNLIDDFLDYLKSAKGLSENTTKEYYYDLKTFISYMMARKGLIDWRDIDEAEIYSVDESFIASIDKRDIYSFMGYLDKQKNNSAKTRHRKLSAINSFFNYLINLNDVIKINPLEGIDMPKIEKSLPVHLSLDEALTLLRTIENSERGDFFKLRDYCIVTLFLNTGMRLSELSNIKLEDLYNDGTLKVTGKGNKERTIYLNRACIKSIERYLKVRPEVSDKYLFLSMRKSKMSNRSIQSMLEKYISEAGLSHKYTVHKLRHTAATLMYQYGNADIRSLQEILGHESVSTTEIYTHINKETLHNTVENNPLSQEEME